MRTALLWLCLLSAAAWTMQGPDPGGILTYIRSTWGVLTRSNSGLAKAAPDPKFHAEAGGRWPVYLPASENLAAVDRELRRQMSPDAYATIVLRPLPAGGAAPALPGLLYLPRPYVVPGGRFNEMYGWDSYFIQVGLLRDHQLELAKGMAENFLYEIRHYGRILNANRTYYLTRSQPPFLTQMLLNVYRETHDKQWLAASLPALDKYYRFWTSQPHLTESGLSRYYDLGDGPAPEVLSAEKDAQGRTHYELVRDYFRAHEIPDYNVAQYYDRAADSLTPLFYKGDRSMRESGFDPSNRFGPFNIDVIHYDPVCLNTLLYLMETDTAAILRTTRQPDAAAWDERAKARAARINRLLWDDADGLYYDYQFEKKQRRKYPYLTTFYPMWAGIASKRQAAAIVRNLPLFERPGGLRTSTFESGNQWDSPFGWAPLEWIAVEGLRRYGYKAEADRIAIAWNSMIREDFRKTGIIVEKYDVVRRASNVSGSIRFGYSSNEAGFGWTNAAYTALYDELSPAQRAGLR